VLQVRLLLLAALCKEHVLYIGPPGTAKSEIGRRLTRLVEGTYFERLLTRFSVPEVPPCLPARLAAHLLVATYCMAAATAPGTQHL
jgi:hypothetical protein